MNVTELEKQILLNIKNSEYQNGVSLFNSWVWSFSVTNEDKSLNGALGSCVKKKLVICDEEDGDEICALTQLGVDYLQSINEKIW